MTAWAYVALAVMFFGAWCVAGTLGVEEPLWFAVGAVSFAIGFTMFFVESSGW